MPERRPFPPSPRRLALARAAGITAASPLLVGAAAAIALVVVIAGLGRAAAAQLGAWIASACGATDGANTVGATADATALGAATDGANALGAAADGANAIDGAAPLPLASVAGAVLELAMPMLVAAAVAGVVLHVAQTRALWLPRRRIPGAPALLRREGTRTMFDSLALIVVGVVTLGWLWVTAPQLSLLVVRPSVAGLAMVSLVVALVIAWLVLAVADALLRRGELGNALSMSREEKREDDRLSAADPRWHAQRLSLLRGHAPSDAVARAAVVVIGDDQAIAIEWDPVRQPVPLRSATGRRARATQLIGLARRHRVAVHRDTELAARLVVNEGPVPEAHWSRLAEIVAATRR